MSCCASSVGGDLGDDSAPLKEATEPLDFIRTDSVLLLDVRVVEYARGLGQNWRACNESESTIASEGEYSTGDAAREQHRGDEGVGIEDRRDHLPDGGFGG